MKKILLLTAIITILISQLATAINIETRQMYIKIPSDNISNVDFMNNNAVSIITANDELIFFSMDPIYYANYKKSPRAKLLPEGMKMQGELFLQNWANNIKSSNPNIIYNKVIPEKNAVISINKDNKQGYYIWCNYIKDDFIFTITCSSKYTFENTKAKSLSLLDTVRRKTL